MFTAVAQKKLARAESYFDEHLAQNDYYAAGEIRPGQWIGAGAERLGLNNAVTRDQFHALCENKNPNDDKRLTLRQEKANQRRVFYDFTCSAPKSVSVLAVTMDDDRLVVAHEEATRIAFRELESFAATRVRKQGNQRDRTTGNLVAAAFTHTSSRALDPLLHTHLTVFNATFDETEKCWKALQAGGMYDAIRYGTAIYRNELAKRVQQIGYRIRPAKHGFEIEGVSDAVLKRFSKRSQQRDAVVRELEQKLGRKLSNNAIALAVHQSRAKKIKGISTAEVREQQLAQLQPDELQALQKLTTSVQPVRRVRRFEPENQALNYAVAHVFERKSVVPEHELLGVALAQHPGELDLPALKEAAKYSDQLVKTERGLSTPQILATELDLIQTVNAACDTLAPIHPTYKPADWLGEDQQRAIYHVLRTHDRITGLRGLAGTGKTTALCELVAACAEAKIEPLFCAPTAAATDVLRKEGFEAKTLQSLLLTKPKLDERRLVVLDEAGAVGIDDMKRLFDLARDARVVLSGDTGQHASVVRGDALRILEQHSNFQSGQLTRIRRQRKAEYRKAVELAVQKRPLEAFAQLERIGAITESSNDNLHDKAAQSYLKALEQNRSALLVAPTWNEIEAVTEKVRAAMKTAGRLAGEEKEFQVFDSLSWTEAQKQDSRQYNPGMAIRFHQRKADFAKDETVAVIAVENDAIKVQREDGSESSFQLGQGFALFDVGEKRKLKIAAGDKLLLQANTGGKRFINGELVEVRAIQGDSVVLADGRVIPQNYRTFTHGYAVTSHAAQGKTVDEVLVVASSRSLAAIHQQQFYVSISRGRERCQIFTDDSERLRSHVTHSSERLAAVEVVPHVSRQKFILRVMERRARRRRMRTDEIFRLAGFGWLKSQAGRFRIKSTGGDKCPDLRCRIAAMSNITLVLESVGRGDAKATEELFPLVYEELRRLAAARMAKEAAGHTLQPTALVHEAWLQLVGAGDRTWKNRAHFFGAAADAMRRILIDNARRKAALKHGGGQERVAIENLEITANTLDEHILMIDEALQRLESDDPEKARIVSLKFFGGLTNEEAAENLGISLSTVKRQWILARIKLFRWIQEQN